MDNDPDKEFLLDGIANGFSLHDSDVLSDPPKKNISVPRNYRSARQHATQIEDQLIGGIEEGHFQVLNDPPLFCSPLSAVEKANGGIRVIHDLSSPTGYCLNDNASKDSDLHFQSVLDAVKHLQPNSYMSKVDLKAAYRSVRIHPSSWKMTGFHWTFKGNTKRTYLCDTRLPFGARKSPAIFHRITQAVRRSLLRRGYCPLVVYIDDFLIISSSFEECQEALQTLISQLRALGFRIAWEKVEGPTQRLTFLGVELDVRTNRMTLNREKKDNLIALMKCHLASKRLSKKQLQKLAGKLSWAAHVIPWGRLHLRRIFDVLKTLTLDHHKCFSTSISTDLEWWVQRLSEANYCEHLWDTRPTITLQCDASQLAGGAFCVNDWFYTSWVADHPALANCHINIKELAIVVLAIERWIDVVRGHRVLVYTDSMATRGILNKATSPCTQAVMLLRKLTNLAMQFDFSVQAFHIRGDDNVLPDIISRFDYRGYLSSFPSSLAHCLSRPCELNDFFLPRHMSLSSFLCLCVQVADHHY